MNDGMKNETTAASMMPTVRTLRRIAATGANGGFPPCIPPAGVTGF